MSQSGPGTTDSNATIEEARRPLKATDWICSVGLVLAPVAVLLMVLAAMQAIYGISYDLSRATYPAYQYGISTTRRDVNVVFDAVAALVGPLAAALLWFDWIGSGMSRRSRIALIGYLCGVIGGMALILVIKPGGVI